MPTPAQERNRIMRVLELNYIVFADVLSSLEPDMQRIFKARIRDGVLQGETQTQWVPIGYWESTRPGEEC